MKLLSGIMFVQDMTQPWENVHQENHLGDYGVRQGQKQTLYSFTNRKDI